MGFLNQEVSWFLQQRIVVPALMQATVTDWSEMQLENTSKCSFMFVNLHISQLSPTFLSFTCGTIKHGMKLQKLIVTHQLGKYQHSRQQETAKTRCQQTCHETTEYFLNDVHYFFLFLPNRLIVIKLWSVISVHIFKLFTGKTSVMILISFF